MLLPPGIEPLPLTLFDYWDSLNSLSLKPWVKISLSSSVFFFQSLLVMGSQKNPTYAVCIWYLNAFSLLLNLYSSPKELYKVSLVCKEPCLLLFWHQATESNRVTQWRHLRPSWQSSALQSLEHVSDCSFVPSAPESRTKAAGQQVAIHIAWLTRSGEFLHWFLKLKSRAQAVVF